MPDFPSLGVIRKPLSDAAKEHARVKRNLRLHALRAKPDATKEAARVKRNLKLRESRAKKLRESRAKADAAKDPAATKEAARVKRNLKLRESRAKADAAKEPDATKEAARVKRNLKLRESRAKPDATKEAARVKRNLRDRESRVKSQFRGVDRLGNRWRARLLQKVIGTYGGESLAAHAYDDAAREHYGDDAVVNFLLDDTPTSQADRASTRPSHATA
jgi:glutaredoxin-related protein